MATHTYATCILPVLRLHSVAWIDYSKLLLSGNVCVHACCTVMDWCPV